MSFRTTRLPPAGAILQPVSHRLLPSGIHALRDAASSLGLGRLAARIGLVGISTLR